MDMLSPVTGGDLDTSGCAGDAAAWEGYCIANPERYISKHDYKNKSSQS